MNFGEDWWKVRDVPEGIGPMMSKELRQGLRRGMFLFPFIGIQLLAIVATAVEFGMDDFERTTAYGGVMNVMMFFPGEMFSGPFWVVAAVVCLVLMPLGGLALMQEELDEGNHELLLMTPLSRWSVVRGKFGALWGICLLTFSSLLPYAIVRYFIGGIDVGRNIALAVTIVLGSGMMAAGAIGVSSFKGIFARVALLGLFLGSAALSLLAALGGAGAQEDGAGVFFNLNGVAGCLAYAVFGLALARSRIRLVVHHYEVKPSWMVVGLLIFTPFVVGMATAVTFGYAGFVGLLGMALVAWFADTTPKAPAWVEAPAPNVPVPPALPDPGGLPLDDAPGVGGEVTREVRPPPEESGS